MLQILYEDPHIIVPVKPVGMEAQSSHSFAPDMVSELRKHINKRSEEHTSELQSRRASS